MESDALGGLGYLGWAVYSILDTVISWTHDLLKNHSWRLSPRRSDVKFR